MPHTDASQVEARLAELLHESAGRQVIVAGHHPLLSGGPTGVTSPFSITSFPCAT